MRTHHDAKLMAKTLRDELKHHNLDLSHGQCLDIVARQFGLKDWNVLAAKVGESVPTSNSLQLPESWMSAGTAPHLYEMGAEPQQAGIATIRRSKNKESSINGVFGTLMQKISAENFIGQHVVFEGELKTLDVSGSATIWLRIDDRQHKLMEFSNLEKHPVGGALNGTNDWTLRRIVLPVPEGAGSVNFGFYLSGFGEAWGRNFNLSTTTDSVTGDLMLLPKTPQNLSFAVT